MKIATQSKQPGARGARPNSKTYVTGSIAPGRGPSPGVRTPARSGR